MSFIAAVMAICEILEKQHSIQNGIRHKQREIKRRQQEVFSMWKQYRELRRDNPGEILEPDRLQLGDEIRKESSAIKELLRNDLRELDQNEKDLDEAGDPIRALDKSKARNEMEKKFGYLQLLDQDVLLRQQRVLCEWHEILDKEQDKIDNLNRVVRGERDKHDIEIKKKA